MVPFKNPRALNNKLLVATVLVLLFCNGLQSCKFNGMEEVLQNQITENPDAFIGDVLIPIERDSLFPEFTDNDLFILVEYRDSNSELIIYKVSGAENRKDLLADAMLMQKAARIMKWQDYLTHSSVMQICKDLSNIIIALPDDRKVAIGIFEGSNLGLLLQQNCHWKNRYIKFISIPVL